MKTIIAGSRGCTRGQTFEAAGLCPWEITEVVSGTCAGPDRFGEEWAALHGIPLKRFPADWKAHGKAAGPIRNRQMADYAGALIAVWDGASRGTANMIEEARSRGLLVQVHEVLT